MAREVPEIDRLIEEGLTLYGQGDLDGALARWERALIIDPDNAQANSYVDYVRANYELLTNDLNGEATSEGAPFGIADDEPEYQIEIQPGEIKPSDAIPSSPEFIDPLDEGWFIDEELRHRGPPSGPAGRPSQELTMELEADEPPLPRTPRATEPPKRAPSQPDVDFDDATREYEKRHHAPAGPDEFGPDGTPGFGHPNDFQTPPGFGNQTTGIKPRDLGFVQASGSKPPLSTTDLGLPVGPRMPAKSTEPPPSSLSELTLEPRAEDAPTQNRAPIAPVELDDMDLISSLPSPRPAAKVRQIEIDTPLSGAPPPKVTTRDFPHQTRAPALPSTKTKDLNPQDLMNAPSIGAAQTQDFEAKTQERNRNLDRTQDIPNMAQAARLAEHNPVVSAPTRDLGLRDAPPREPATSRDGTRADVVLQFDPIDARTHDIIEDVDETAPREEAREDKTRRRITTLFEKAMLWTGEGDLERAVAAVDLALSEDPGSALAQKLIHRNRETIMSVFQTYLGDLQRTPQLARPLHELANAPISPRAAFLLSRIDGLLSIDEILDVCGMPRLEAYRYLCQLFLRGILR